MFLKVSIVTQSHHWFVSGAHGVCTIEEQTLPMMFAGIILRSCCGILMILFNYCNQVFLLYSIAAIKFVIILLYSSAIMMLSFLKPLSDTFLVQGFIEYITLSFVSLSSHHGDQ